MNVKLDCVCIQIQGYSGNQSSINLINMDCGVYKYKDNTGNSPVFFE